MSDIPVVLDEIQRHFDLPQPPALFARLAADEPYLATTWHKFKTVLGGDGIDLATKQLMGLAVAVAKANDCVIGLPRGELHRSGLDAREELEALAVTEFFEGFDSFAHALRVDSDLRPRRLAAGDLSLIDRELDVNVPYVVEAACVVDLFAGLCSLACGLGLTRTNVPPG